MKKYFMQSKVYKQFKEEQDQEMEEDNDCQYSPEEFKDLKTKFVSLSERYEDLQKEVHAQALKTKSLTQKIKTPVSMMAQAPDSSMNKVGLVPPPPDR
jgi:predicted  nucleic acid-binding Zn-ribbon protein